MDKKLICFHLDHSLGGPFNYGSSGFVVFASVKLVINSCDIVTIDLNLLVRSISGHQGNHGF
jgi:hypothetical protein